MLHVGILPAHGAGATFLMRLRYVVVDELHTLRGVFGGHVAHVLRRLQRICAHYGAEPTLCFSSATIGNPAELASALRGITDRSGDGRRSTGRSSGASCAGSGRCSTRTSVLGVGERRDRDVLARFVAEGHQTLAFSRSPEGRRARRRPGAGAPRRGRPPYRSRGAPRSPPIGPVTSRRTARARGALTEGDLAGIVATSALELGIDVGGLDAIIVNGFPGTLASFRQQLGRAGRGGRPSAAVLVAGDDQLDQWYAARIPERCSIVRPSARSSNPDNPFVLRAHVGCAAHEIPIVPRPTSAWFGPGLDDAVRELVLADAAEAAAAGRMY